MPIEPPPASLTPSDPGPLASLVHAWSPTDRQKFRAPTLDCTMASVDFTVFTADLATRRQRRTGN